MNCPCGSNLEYSKCCEPYIKGEKKAPTAEALMRARYTAYSKAEIGFIKETLAPETRSDFNEKSARDWAQKSEWKGLQIQSVKQGKETDNKGVVEFTAKYKTEGKTLEHHEVAEFRKSDGKWYFVDGDSHTHEEGHGHHHHHEPVQPVVRAAPKVGRNDPCPCGSGKKYKKCHGANE